ncbi:hypothetical protein BZG36_05377 [Bifiguratus adelaidae]|uniref:Zn(2)-C6 fungal-type domain-containing protein n=1 Tax=Bifiguratus adelaidae TaxID=1938954 RepID=A0A261XUP9_9FUNG|nr:hypothetical protein BZG36_05377 [Bifiguratus adelaidae]
MSTQDPTSRSAINLLLHEDAPASRPQRTLRKHYKVWQACDFCRRHKYKCSGGTPCARCARSRGGRCTYELPYKRDKRRQSNVQDTPSSSTSREQSAAFASRDAPPDSYYGSSSNISFLRQAQEALDNDVNEAVYRIGDREFPDFEVASFILPPEPVAKELVDRYFNFNSPTYRFLDPQEIGKSLKKLYADPVSLDPSRAAVLFLIFAWGADGVKKPHCGTANSIRYFQAAERHLKGVQLSLIKVQADLLRSLYNLSSSRANAAWTLFGVVVRDAQALGLHRRLHKVDDENLHLLQRQLWTAIYILDRYLAVYFGRPCAIHDEDVDQSFPELSSDTNELDKSLLAPRYHAELAVILGRAMRLLYGPVIATSGTLATADNLYREICVWKEELPAFLNAQKLDPNCLEGLFRR